MSRFILVLAIVGCLSVPPQIFAATELYFATGEDIDNLINDDNASGLYEIEEQLSEFSLFRSLEKYFFNITYSSDEKNEDYYTVGDDE